MHDFITCKLYSDAFVFQGKHANHTDHLPPEGFGEFIILSILNPFGCVIGSATHWAYLEVVASEIIIQGLSKFFGGWRVYKNSCSSRYVLKDKLLILDTWVLLCHQSESLFQ